MHQEIVIIKYLWCDPQIIEVMAWAGLGGPAVLQSGFWRIAGRVSNRLDKIQVCMLYTMLLLDVLPLRMKWNSRFVRFEVSGNTNPNTRWEATVGCPNEEIPDNWPAVTFQISGSGIWVPICLSTESLFHALKVQEYRILLEDWRLVPMKCRF